MSSKELRRKTVMDEVAGGRRKLRSAAEVLQISYRQCRRVYQRYRQQGDQGLIHRNRGRESNRKIGVEQRRQRHLSIKLCLTGGSSGLLKTRLKQSIELRKSRGDAAGQGSPTAIFQRGDGESKFELQGLFRVKVTATVAAHNLQLAIDGFNDVCG